MAAPRTGSTALAESLAVRHKLELFCEPFDTFPPPWRADKHVNGVFVDFYNWYKNERTGQFVVKFMPHQISVLNPYADILKNSFKIKLFREDQVAQISSFYVASVRRKFFKKRGEAPETFTVPIDPEGLLQSAGFILNQAYLLDNLRVDWDYATSYESLGFLDESSKIVSDVAENLDEVKWEVTNLIARWY